MKQIRRKLFLSIFMLFVTAVTLTSTTFAWFARNKEAWTDEFELEIENTDGLLISVDGKNYRSSIPNNLLKKAIVAKQLNVPIDSVALTDEYVNKVFKDMQLKSVTTNDLVNYKSINDDERFVIENSYNLVDANFFDYLSFDLWFKVAASKKATAKYDIKFVSDQYAEEFETTTSYIECDESVVKLHNKLSTIDKDYNSEEEISLNAKNAIRIGIIHNDTSQKTIYEPYEGVGSYALAGATEDKYNPDKNAMLTYFNNLHEAKLEPLNSNLDLYKNTQKDFNGDISFGQIIPNENNTDYIPIKITVSVWLEGFDADYIMGISNTSLKMMLNFCMIEIKGENNDEA